MNKIVRTCPAMFFKTRNVGLQHSGMVLSGESPDVQVILVLITSEIPSRHFMWMRFSSVLFGWDVWVTSVGQNSPNKGGSISSTDTGLVTFQQVLGCSGNTWEVVIGTDIIPWCTEVLEGTNPPQIIDRMSLHKTNSWEKQSESSFLYKVYTYSEIIIFDSKGSCTINH